MIKRNIIPVLICLLAVLASCKKDNPGGFNAGAPILIDSFIPASGGGGTEILLSGSNFSSDTNMIRVTLNGNPLKVIGTNGRQIMAVVPTKAGSGHLVVTVNGKTDSSAGIFNYVFSWQVTTLAGTGVAGYADGPGAYAQFNFNGNSGNRSLGIVVDTNLNVYVADIGNHCIRKIDSLGNVSVLAGNPAQAGYGDGTGTGAEFELPYDLALDGQGNVWSADPWNWDIRMITPQGVATTMGWGAGAPYGIAYNPKDKNIYMNIIGNPNSVYQLQNPGSGSSDAFVVSYPTYLGAIRFDSAGNLYASGNQDNEIHEFAAGTWAETTICGNGTAGYVNGPAATAEFSQPWGMCLDGQGNLYVAGNGDQYGSTANPDQSIRVIQPGTWTVSTLAGSGTAGFLNNIGTGAEFSAPGGVCVDKNGAVYVLDKNNNAIRKIVSY